MSNATYAVDAVADRIIEEKLLGTQPKTILEIAQRLTRSKTPHPQTLLMVSKALFELQEFEQVAARSMNKQGQEVWRIRECH